MEKAYRTEEARTRRRKRRKRQQRIYTLIAILLFLVIAGGLGFGGYVLYQRYFAENAGAGSSAAAHTASDNPEEDGLTREERINRDVEELIASMTLPDKVSALFLVTPEQLTGEQNIVTTAGDQLRSALQTYPVAGLVFSDAHITSGSQIKKLLADVKGMSAHPMFLATRELGGSMSAVSNATGVPVMSSPSSIGAAADSAEAAYAAEQIANTLRDTGFNLNLAPSANLTQYVTDGSTYAEDVRIVTECASAFVESARQQNIAVAVGAFPAAGAEDNGGDPANNTTADTMNELQESVFVPFQACVDAGADIVMLSNITAPRALGTNVPCSMSESMIGGQLRGTMGFTGIVMTDAFDQHVIRDGYTSDAAAVSALLAGADIIYRPFDFTLAHQGIMEALENGVLTEDRIDQSLRRIYRTLYAME